MKKIYEICELCHNLTDHRITLKIVGYLYNDSNHQIIYFNVLCPSCCFKKDKECKKWVSV